MKILYFSSDNNKTSGAFICMVQQIRILKQKYGVDSQVVLPFDGDGKELLEEYQIPWHIIKSKHWIVKKNQSVTERAIINLKMTVKCLMNLVSIKKSVKLIKRIKPDIVHLNTTYCYIGAVAAKECGVPVIWHLRELVEEGMGNKIWNRNYGYKLMNQSKSIICVSNSVKRTYEGVFPEYKLDVVYDGVEVDKYSFNIEKENDCIYMVCVGALGEHKGQEAIIRACSMLKEKTSTKFKLYIIGRGPSEAKYRTLIHDLDLDEYVELCGVKDNVQDYYHKAHFTIVNGFKEGFGRVTVEAMLCGSYVIGCDTGGTIELTQDGKYGIVFRHNDVEDLYQKLLYAIDHLELLMSERLKCRDYAVENFSSEKNASAIYAVYKKVLTK